ncbi:MAG: hypothetical protein COB39_00480 [Marinosulfonomonas sp.]|nr:MAG: hypothetical protein COB39_00480 [Marinosulfonomonas sp.]
MPHSFAQGLVLGLARPLCRLKHRALAVGAGFDLEFLADLIFEFGHATVHQFMQSAGQFQCFLVAQQVVSLDPNGEVRLLHG